MSKATKKKYVKREIVESDYIPQNGQFIAKVSINLGIAICNCTLKLLQ